MITRDQLRAMEMRTAKQINGPHMGGIEFRASKSNGVELEIPGLHKPIIEWCNSQIPAVPFIHARSDKPSELPPGWADFTIFYCGKIYLIECKSRTGKISNDQRICAYLLGRQGFNVAEVRTFQQFLELIKK